MQQIEKKRILTGHRNRTLTHTQTPSHSRCLMRPPSDVSFDSLPNMFEKEKSYPSIFPHHFRTHGRRGCAEGQTTTHSHTHKKKYSCRNGEKLQGSPALPKLSYEGKIKLKVSVIARTRFKNREGEISRSSSCD